MTESERPGAVAALPTHIGKYDVVRVLGRGAMGVVYHAHDPLLDRDVALKVMLPQTAADPDQKARFEREARAAAKIVHRNVLTVFDLGYHQDGSPYIAMEMLKGKDLLQTMREDAPLPLDQKLNVIVQLLDGLAHAHEVGVIHRDIKPANVFLAADGTVKIMDFGVARFTMSAATNTGMVMGTPDYMSPEQVQGGKLDGRTDLWSVGCMLHELITGARPFAAESLMTIFYRITHEAPSPDLPSGAQYDPLRHVVKRALARDVNQRYATAAEFAAELRQILKALPPDAQVAAAPAADAPIPTEVPTTEHAVDLLESLAEEEIAALASAMRRGPPAPVVKPAAATPPPGGEVERRAPPSDPTPLFRLMRDVFAAGKTGHLHFAHGSQRRSLFFVHGNILHGTTDVEGEHLGHVLVRYGFIDQATLESLVPIVLRERKRLGVLLQEKGILTAARLDEGIGLHVRDILFDMVDRSEGRFSFEEMMVDGAADVKAQILPGQIILEAARRLQAPEIVTKVLGDVDRPLVMSARARVAVQKLTLSPTDGFLLSRIDGTLTAREIFQIIPLPQEDVERSLFALLCTGTVEYGTRTVTSRGRGSDADRGSAAPESMRVPVAPAPRREPAPPVVPEVQRAAPAPVPATPPPASAPTPAPVVAAVIDDTGPTDEERLATARESVGKAEQLLSEGRAQDAIAELGPALVLLLGEESIRARVALARAYMTMPKLRGRAEGVLTEAIRDSPKDPALHLLLGRLHVQRGNRDPAITSFRNALKIAPGDADAQAELDALGVPAPDAPKTGRHRRSSG